MSKPKLFPIQRSSPIPWRLAQRAYDTYARLYGTSQSLEMLASRGGFGLQEFACLFAGHESEAGHTECVAKADAVGRHMAMLEETVEKLKADLAAQHDPTGDLIHANRDEILRKHKECVRLVRRHLEAARDNLGPVAGGTAPDLRSTQVAHGAVLLALATIEALGMFHPMHADWTGFPAAPPETTP